MENGKNTFGKYPSSKIFTEVCTCQNLEKESESKAEYNMSTRVIRILLDELLVSYRHRTAKLPSVVHLDSQHDARLHIGGQHHLSMSEYETGVNTCHSYLRIKSRPKPQIVMY